MILNNAMKKDHHKKRQSKARISFLTHSFTHARNLLLIPGSLHCVCILSFLINAISMEVNIPPIVNLLTRLLVYGCLYCWQISEESACTSKLKIYVQFLCFNFECIPVRSKFWQTSFFLLRYCIYGKDKKIGRSAIWIVPSIFNLHHLSHLLSNIPSR